MKKSVFQKKLKNQVIENIQATGGNRLQSFLTRSNFCDFVAREFFNSHRISQQRSVARLVGNRMARAFDGITFRNSGRSSDVMKSNDLLAVR